MVIELVNEALLLILLEKDDMFQYGITLESFDYDNPDSRLAVREILDLAQTQTGFDCRQKKMRMEMLPKADGCLMIFTILEDRSKTKGKRYKVKAAGPYVYQFSTAEDLLQCAKALPQALVQPSNSLLYARGGHYQLVVEEGWSQPLHHNLTEFSRLLGKGKVLKAALEEHSSRLLAGRALQTMHALL